MIYPTALEYFGMFLCAAGCGFLFGVWQRNYYAGLWMLTLAYSWITFSVQVLHNLYKP